MLPQFCYKILYKTERINIGIMMDWLEQLPKLQSL